MPRAALVVGPLLFFGTLLAAPPAELTADAWHVAGLASWMAVWWLTAVVPLEATALLPIVVLPLVGAGPVGTVTASYADPIIFLFLGGFFLAATLERWNLHKRFALATVRAVGTNAPRVVLAFMLASAIASMWISNTATALMMLPIAAAVVGGSGEFADDASAASRAQFSTALMLGIAYGASIGGVATLIGTPPNAILAGAARELLDVDIDFGSWLGLGLSVSIPMFVGCWIWLVWIHRVRGEVPGLAAAVDREHRSLGALSGAERYVLVVFVLTALSWILRAPKSVGPLRIPGLTDFVPGISDAGIAITAALLLFVTPLRKSRFRVALDWESARKVPWGILLLFGGGLALAAAFGRSGLTEWLGLLLQGLAGAPVVVVLLTTAGLFVLLTELTSNTATAALGMPLMVGVAAGLGLPPLPLMIAAALAASMAFMLPVATPPNAIVFGSGMITSRQMARAGIGLNVLAVAIITIVVWLRGV
jgi:sodium-dependent dicarboxylate transporter 2/3/5